LPWLQAASEAAGTFLGGAEEDPKRQRRCAEAPGGGGTRNLDIGVFVACARPMRRQLGDARNACIVLYLRVKSVLYVPESGLGARGGGPTALHGPVSRLSENQARGTRPTWNTSLPRRVSRERQQCDHSEGPQGNIQLRTRIVSNASSPCLPVLKSRWTGRERAPGLTFGVANDLCGRAPKEKIFNMPDRFRAPQPAT